MPRIAPVVAVGVPHHVTQRGNNRQPVFLNDFDRRSYCQLLAEWSRRCGIRVLGYCLMTNHVHLVVVPERADALARGLGRAHFLYTRDFHFHHGTSGHLWQNRFFSAALDRRHFLAALRYVDLNPVRAGMVSRAEAYCWSSAQAHVTGSDVRQLLDMERWREVPPATRRGTVARDLRTGGLGGTVAPRRGAGRARALEERHANRPSLWRCRVR